VKRLVWVGVGVAVTVVVLRQGRKVVRRYGPAAAVDDMTARANDIGGRLTRVARDFGGEFRTARAAREAELRASLLADGQADPDVVRAEREASRAVRDAEKAVRDAEKAERDAAKASREAAQAEREAGAPEGPLPQDPEDPDTGYAFF
jgi:hypothetical protein